LRQGQEHLTGRQVWEPGREQRETALVAADDPELLTRQPGQPVPRNTAGLQQVDKPIPARARGDLLANTSDEVGSELAGPAFHASTLLPGQPGLDLTYSQEWAHAGVTVRSGAVAGISELGDANGRGRPGVLAPLLRRGFIRQAARRSVVLPYRGDMPARKRPAPEDAVTARQTLLDGLARGADIFELVSELAPLHPRDNTFPGEVFLHLAADALTWCGASRVDPLPLEGLRDRFLPERTLRGRQNHKLQYAVLAAAALHGGTEPDLLDEVAWWQTDDFWQYALFAVVVYIRAAASRAGVPVRQTCQDLAQRPGTPVP
jgi:hypothetical protein